MTRHCSTIIIGLVAAAGLGCHTMNFEVGDGPVSEIVYHRKPYYVGGLFPTREIDVSRHCPYGAIRIREETLFSDGVFNLITLGIYTPRSTWYHCAAEATP